MAYSKINWDEVTPINPANLDHMETQYDSVKTEVEKTDGSSDIQPHGSNLVNGSVAVAKLAFNPATQADLNAHESDTTNPHEVTAPQTGAAPNPHGNEAHSPNFATTADLAAKADDPHGNEAHDENYAPSASGSYVGDEGGQRTINVGFTPKQVMIWGGDNIPSGNASLWILDQTGSFVLVSGDNAISDGTFLKCVANGFRVGGGNHIANVSGETYRWVAIG